MENKKIEMMDILLMKEIHRYDDVYDFNKKPLEVVVLSQDIEIDNMPFVYVLDGEIPKNLNYNYLGSYKKEKKKQAQSIRNNIKFALKDVLNNFNKITGINIKLDLSRVLIISTKKDKFFFKK